jgi:hypothetical protein
MEEHHIKGGWIEWICPVNLMPSRYTERNEKRKTKTKKKRNKTEKHFLISLRRVSTISVPNMIDCCDRMSGTAGILETHKSGPGCRLMHLELHGIEKLH